MDMQIKDRHSAPLQVKGLEVVIRISERVDIRTRFLPQGEAQQDEAPVAPAYFAGRQQGTDGLEGFDLFILTEEIPGYVQWSTVSGRTLKTAGYRLPPCVPNQDHERALDKIRRLARLMAR